VDFRNITLRNVVIVEPTLSPGIILGNETNPMDITFDGVVVANWSALPTIPYGRKYQCEFTDMKLIGTNSPKPDCSKPPQSQPPGQ
jgi:hypothetical protein